MEGNGLYKNLTCEGKKKASENAYRESIIGLKSEICKCDSAGDDFHSIAGYTSAAPEGLFSSGFHVFSGDE